MRWREVVASQWTDRSWCSENAVDTDGGGSRDVYIFGDFVVKFQSGYAKAENRQEAAIWGAVKGTKYEKLFFEVLAITENGKILVMRKATETGRYASSPGVWRAQAKLRKALSRLGIGDMCDFNMGVYRNQWKILDYAYIEEWDYENRKAVAHDSPLRKPGTLISLDKFASTNPRSWT